MNDQTQFLTLPDRRIAYQQQSCRICTKDDPGVIFLGGFGSDMMGTKACFLAEKAAESGLSFVRFDYCGHGQSSGRFEDGTIGDWASDALQIFDRVTQGPQILIGSSMGGWIGLLLARARPERVAGFLGVSTAPDFTEDLIIPFLTDEQKAILNRDGSIDDPTAPPGEGHKITKKLIETGKDSLVLRSKLVLAGPLHLIQGQQDQDVPWKTALRLLERVDAPSARLTLVKEGNHRMNRPQDLELIWETVNSLRQRAGKF